MGKLILIRHGLSEANEAKIYGLDSPLSATGMEELSLIDKKELFKPDILITGTQIRQVQTAQLLFPDHTISNQTPLFNEINYGILEKCKITDGLRNEIIKDVTVIHKKYDGDDVWRRAQDALTFINDMLYYKSKIIVIISSAMLIQSILGIVNAQKTGKLAFDEKYHLKNLQYIEFNPYDLTKFEIKNFAKKEKFFWEK